MKFNIIKLLSLPESVASRLLPKVAVLVLLLVLVILGAVPSYWTGNWSWKEPPPVANLKQLRTLRETGLNLPGWRTVEQNLQTLGGHKWSVQTLERDKRSLRLLLLPQGNNKSQPQVEWVDINGFEQWKTDSYSTIQFAPSTPSSNAIALRPRYANAQARFFRAYPRPDLSPKALGSLSEEQRQTRAVLQWYAWSEGGHPAPSQWFVRDRLAQLRRSRVPWVAVCLQISIEPLGDIEDARPLAESLAKMVQTALMADPLARASSAR